MLDHALLFVRDKLDAHLRRRLGVSDPVVVLNHLSVHGDGQIQKNQNRMVMTLSMLEYETNKAYYNGPVNTQTRKNPPQRFNLNLLLSANFDDYVEALKVLSETILFFQATPAFQANEFPDMPQGLTALQFEVDGTSEGKTRELWNTLGANYLPSILYKVRHITIDASQIADVHTATQRIEVEVGA